MATDTLDFAVSGTVDLAPTVNSLITNAAGILTAPAPSFDGGGQIGEYYGPYPALTRNGGSTFSAYGALIVSVNGGPTQQIFSNSSAANGFGSPTPPTILTFLGTVGSFASGGLADGDTLTFSVQDIVPADNTGSFTISAITPTVPEMEPSTATLRFTLLGLGLVLVGDRRLRRA